MKVLVSPDKFKGTLTASEAAAAIATGWRQSRPGDDLELLPISDGGDGFGEVMGRLMEGELQTSKTVDAARRPCEASWWWVASSQTAIVESARVIGLAQLAGAKYHPFELDTRGLGQLLAEIAERGARRCLVGIGGSATNDGGFGLAKALDWKFFNAHGEKIDRWTELHDLAEIRPPDQTQLFNQFIVAVDVQNPLLGPAGCTRIYGPQKGLLPSDFDFAERCLDRLSEVLRKELHRDLANEPGAGAAGGLGFGLRCFAEASLEPGFALFAEQSRIVERVETADVVLTGEGSLDGSSLMGKGVGELAVLCRERGIPCIGLAGVVPDRAKAAQFFTDAHAMSPEFTSSENALAEPAHWLEELAARIAANWPPASPG